MEFTVSREGEPCDDYQWDLKTRIFKSSRSRLVIDMSKSTYGITIKVEDHCVIKAGDNCLIDAGNDSIIDAGDNCFIKAGSFSAIKAEEACTVKVSIKGIIDVGSFSVVKTRSNCAITTEESCIVKTGGYSVVKTAWNCAVKANSDGVVVTRSDVINECIQLSKDQTIKTGSQNIKGHEFIEEDIDSEGYCIKERDSTVDKYLSLREELFSARDGEIIDQNPRNRVHELTEEMSSLWNSMTEEHQKEFYRREKIRLNPVVFKYLKLQSELFLIRDKELTEEMSDLWNTMNEEQQKYVESTVLTDFG